MVIVSFAYAKVKKTYYKSGELKSKTSLENNMKNGIENVYYKSGELWTETPFKNDKKME